ncbi:MAG TPA: hypothetical protein VG096_12270 [Bryobacteraceae bacterium]|nr:hypothetical protein [Bryobacteraceae bacterium]
MKLSRLLEVAVVASALWAQPPVGAGHTWAVPALGFGPNAWSILRLTNRAPTPRSLRLEVYGENGDRLPVTGELNLSAGETREIRIDGQTGDEQSCWAKVTELSDEPAVDVDASIELLKGNAIVSYRRKAESPSVNDVWVTLATQVEGKQVYFLNVFDQPTTLEFCATNKREQRTCRTQGRTAAARFRVNPNQSIGVQVQKLRQRYFIAESTVPGKAILLLFTEGQGSKRVFSSESNIEFDTPPR